MQNPSDDEIALSLWPTLHDGDLIDAIWDSAGGLVTFRFDVGYVRRFHNLAEDTRFTVCVQGVQSLFVNSNGYLGQGEIVLPWTEFEAAMSEGLEVSTASLTAKQAWTAKQVRTEVMLGLIDSFGAYFEIRASGESVSFLVSGNEMEAEAFVDLGEKYWENFARRRSPDGS